MTYFRRFYLDQSIFEFDPIEMMFACFFLAAKIEETQFGPCIINSIETYVKMIGEEKFCNIESMIILDLRFRYRIK